AGATTARHDPLLLTPFLRELGEWFALLVRARPVRFACDVPDDLPPVSGEAAKLRGVVQNLLSNAEKFIQRGEIVLSARPFTRDRGAGSGPGKRRGVQGVDLRRVPAARICPRGRGGRRARARPRPPLRPDDGR